MKRKSLVKLTSDVIICKYRIKVILWVDMKNFLLSDKRKKLSRRSYILIVLI